MNAPAMLARAPIVPSPYVAAGWAVFSFDTVQLALPQKYVRQIELAADLKLSAAGENLQAGWLLREDDESWPAYCFDGALGLLRPAPEARRVCVFFESGGNVFGLLCDRVWSLATDAELEVEPLPGCMTGPVSPVTGIARYRGRIVGVTSAAALAAYIDQFREPSRGADE